ncbi:MAG: DUF1425 domain-containing protein [Terasakiella sp.]|uniref:DUF1425 domain-containing protein n=1 Tax=unclassified Terasakiella TaxID=2614952 RepID=UPI003AFFA047
MLRKAYFLLLLGALFFSDSGLSYAEDGIVDQSHPRARLVLGSADLVDKVKIIKPRVAPLGNFMRGQVMVQNLTDAKFLLDYKFDWLDDEGFLVGDGGVWFPIVLGPREMKPFKSLGKSEFAARMQVTVRLTR